MARTTLMVGALLLSACGYRVQTAPGAEAELAVATADPVIGLAVSGAVPLESTDRLATSSGATGLLDTWVIREFIYTGSIDSAAAVYRQTAEESGWRLDRAECSTVENRAALTFFHTDSERGSLIVDFRPGRDQNHEPVDGTWLRVWIRVSDTTGQAPAGIEAPMDCLR